MQFILRLDYTFLYKIKKLHFITYTLRLFMLNKVESSIKFCFSIIKRNTVVICDGEVFVLIKTLIFGHSVTFQTFWKTDTF